MISLLNAGVFSLGKSKEKENQDSVLLPTSFGEGYIFAVADGVGAYTGAEAASSLAVGELLRLVIDNNSNIWSVFPTIHSKMNELSINDYKYHNSATTLSFCHINEKTIRIGHIGDTRVYVRNRGKLVQLTKDHTVYQELLDEGLYSKKDLELLSEGKNTLTSALSRSKNSKFQTLEFSTGDFLSEDNTIDIYIMSDGAYYYWEKRPRFSLNTLKNPAKFASALQKRIETKGPVDDYSLISVRLLLR